jgi:hypothetical protein
LAIAPEYLPTGGSTSGYNNIYGALDEPYPQFPEAGMTLADAFSGIPLMSETIQVAGLPSHFIRGTIRVDVRGTPEQWSSDLNILLHPSPLNSAIIDRTGTNANNVDRITVVEIGAGYQLLLQADWINGHCGMLLPPAAMIDTSEWKMWCNKPSLNEFGYFYLALYLAGNYARYFPDKWLVDVEGSSPLALAIEELCDLSEWRVPWLSLCEMDMTLYVRAK